MAKKIKTDIAASIRARLLMYAKKENKDFSAVLRQFGQERLLYRIAVSPWSENFVLKGALLFLAFEIPRSRPTKDIDLLGQSLPPDLNKMKNIFKEIAGIKCEDGIIFDPTSVTTSRIKEGQQYEGIRAYINGKLGNARINVQLDIGFGDVVSYAPGKRHYPCILDLPAPMIAVYSKETALAEKIEAISKLGLATSRMKDFYDIYHMAGNASFTKTRLFSAIKRTFAKRETDISLLNVFRLEDWKINPDKQIQWQSFLKRHLLTPGPSLSMVIDSINSFIDGLLKTADSPTENWDPKEWKWKERQNDE